MTLALVLFLVFVALAAWLERQLRHTKRRLVLMRKAAVLLLETVRYDSQDRRMPMEPDPWPCSCSPQDEDDMRWGCPRCRLVRAGLLPPDPTKPDGPVSPDDDIPF